MKTDGGKHSLFDQFERHPIIIAHRGHRACFPENTLCAFAASLGRCDMIELDVRLSADGVAVVFHDQLLWRTSDAVAKAFEVDQRSLAVHDWRYVQLSQLDVGSWFLETDPFDTIEQGRVDRRELLALMPQRLPSLRRVLYWAVTNNMPLNIEIKEMGTTRLNEALVAEVIHDVAVTATGQQVVLSSFNHSMLRMCQWLAPHLATAALQEGSHPPDLLSYLQNLGVCAYHPSDQIVDADLIHVVRSIGIRVNVFTVNDVLRQRQLFAAGATGFFTDYLMDDA
ncbi:glycerophosphodiester phosphodiesterase [Desulfobulbus oligotrophicus]|uniref:GP-PDE domain-containing protein n=1 Tax=Desulfobulbus oligotrophicus TaxID=1909699 RepID=A0A7T5VE91_9BACT|nr:glycerophosphodiester phosphodiesterase family protein [Desulfobulbus oligotrophicus]QQG66274.1 hypothetical protein HP555_10575 [Desulfobulbus oligotrophicus]